MEKIKHSKTNNEIKEDIIDLKIRRYKVDEKADDESIKITQSFLDKNNKLKGKSLDFFYNECLDTLLENGEYKNEKMRTYFRTLKYDLSIAFDIPEIL